MREVIVRDSSGQVRGEGIGQSTSHQADVLITVDGKPDARCRGGNINGLGKGVVEVELDSMAELLAQAHLQSVIARTADGTPSIHREGLVIQEFAGASV